MWPDIDAVESYTDDGFKVRLTDKGVGPALMSDVSIVSNGKIVGDLDQLILETLGPEDAFSYELYATSNPSNSVAAWAGSVDIETCYCSIHSECWQTKLSAERTEAAKVCKTGTSW